MGAIEEALESSKPWKDAALDNWGRIGFGDKIDIPADDDIRLIPELGGSTVVTGIGASAVPIPGDDVGEYGVGEVKVDIEGVAGLDDLSAATATLKSGFVDTG
jgi:hypothetical protein